MDFKTPVRIASTRLWMSTRGPQSFAGLHEEAHRRCSKLSAELSGATFRQSNCGLLEALPRYP